MRKKSVIPSLDCFKIKHQLDLDLHVESNLILSSLLQSQVPASPGSFELGAAAFIYFERIGAMTVCRDAR